MVRPEIWRRYREVARSASAWIVDGELQSHQEVIHVVATRIANLNELTDRLDSWSDIFIGGHSTLSIEYQYESVQTEP